MSGKFMFALCTILLVVLAICKSEMAQPIIEGWNGMDGFRTVIKRPVIQNPKTRAIYSYGPDMLIDPVKCGAPAGAGTDRANTPGGSKEKYIGSSRENFENADVWAGPSPYVNPYGEKVMYDGKGVGAMVPQQVSQDPSPPLMGSGKFFSNPNFQAVLSPRFDSNNNYGAFINYNRPDQKNMASPVDPLSYESFRENYVSGPVRENFADGSQVSSPPSCGKGGYGFAANLAGGFSVPPAYANGNKNQVYESLPGIVVSNACGGPPGASSSDVPTGTITLTDDNGHPTQYLMQDRYMYSLKKSKLWGLGDPIRGDLAIAPMYHGNADVFPNIASDVNRGALGVMGGDRAVDPDLVDLVGQSSGLNDPSVGGIIPNMSTQTDSSASGNCTDLHITAFP